MPISIDRSPEGFAGSVTGVDCAAPLAPEEVAAIEAGMNKHAVLVFHDQPLTDAQQLGFTLHFGKLEKYATPGDVRKPGDRRLGAGMADLSNLTPDGRVMSAEDRNWLFKLGDRLWHSDSSFRPVTAKYSLLSGRVIPSWGGDTEFADMRAAYAALDDRTKAEIKDLVCEHSLIYSRGSIGFAEMTPEEKENFRPCITISCARIRRRVASRCSCHRMPGRSSAGRFRRRECCCATSPSMQRNLSSSIVIAGSRMISSYGTTERRCTAHAGSIATRCAMSGARRWPAKRCPGMHRSSIVA